MYILKRVLHSYPVTPHMYTPVRHGGLILMFDGEEDGNVTIGLMRDCTLYSSALATARSSYLELMMAAV